MIVTLMPLFLAAGISVNNNDWKYGPEVIYDAKIDGVSPDLDASGSTVTFNTTVKLACRPKSEFILTWTVLTCTFHKPTTELTLWNLVRGTRMLGTYKEYLARFPETTSFEIDFNPKNERPLVVDDSIDSERLNLVRVLVDQLIVDANLPTATETTLDLESNSVLGKCKTRYVKLRRKMTRDEARNEKNKRISMILLPDNKPLKGEVLEMKRNVDLDNCRRLLSSSKLEVNRRVISSESHVIVTESNFMSYTDFDVGFYKGSARSVGRERITVTLDKVVPAKGPLPLANPWITDPVTFGIQATKAFYSDCTDSGYETKLYDEWLALIDYEKKTNEASQRLV